MADLLPSSTRQLHRLAEQGYLQHSHGSPHGLGIGFHWWCTLSGSLLCWPLLDALERCPPCLSVEALGRNGPPFCTHSTGTKKQEKAQKNIKSNNSTQANRLKLHQGPHGFENCTQCFSGQMKVSFSRRAGDRKWGQSHTQLVSNLCCRSWGEINVQYIKNNRRGP